MKKTFFLIFSVLLPIMACAQAKVQTKQYILNDLPQKTMKVILTGDEMFDAAIRNDIQDIWHICPYEFCDSEEFETLKKSDDYYFMALSATKYGSELTPGIKSLTIFKGRDTAGEGFDGLYKVIGIPVCPAQNTEYREVAMLPAFIHVLQENIRKIMKRPINLGNGAMVTASMRKGKWNKEILVSRSDASFPLGTSVEAIYRHDNVHFVNDEDIEKAVSERSAGKFVCYCVAPSEPEKGSVSYTMLFDSESYELLYIKSHVITAKSPKGVLKNELALFIKRNR